MMKDRIETFATQVIKMVDDMLDTHKPTFSNIPPFALIKARPNHERSMPSLCYVSMEPGVNVFTSEANDMQELIDETNAECVAVIYTGTRLEVESEQEMEAVRGSTGMNEIMKDFGEPCIGVFLMSADYVKYTTRRYESYEDNSNWDSAPTFTIEAARKSGLTMPPFTVRR